MSRVIKIGEKFIGGDHPILIQSMTNTKTSDIEATVEQIKKLQEAGCDIIRVAVPDIKSAEALSEIKKQVNIPIVADIHFDCKLALAAIENGADKIRINPGNIGGYENFKIVLDKAKEKNIPIRIGVNSGSLEKDLLEKYHSPTPEALFESMMRYIRFCEENDFYDIVLSIKASNVKDMIEANKLLSENTDYPLHLGVTEAGLGESAIVKSSIGIGTLLAENVGDTIRVSLTEDPVKEIEIARDILSALNLKIQTPKPEIISCPTCARTSINLMDIANKVSEGLKGVNKEITVAIMGCSVNGPGEAREADIGIAGAGENAILFKRGEIVKSVRQEEIVKTLLDEIENL